jgi:DNA polymerase III delta prime subunit
MEQLACLLKTYDQTRSIPHLLIHGEVHAGKRQLLSQLLAHVYPEPGMVSDYCMFIECATCKGIKVIRDDIKEFAKHQINRVDFKSIVLYDAENLTIDAQYSLRRCIEIYSNTTRFFIVTSNKDRLLTPICSRFIHVYVPKPPREVELPKWTPTQKALLRNAKKETLGDLAELAETLYNKGVSGDMLLRQYSSLMRFKYENVSRHLKNEKLVLFYLLQQQHLPLETS